MKPVIIFLRALFLLSILSTKILSQNPYSILYSDPDSSLWIRTSDMIRTSDDGLLMGYTHNPSFHPYLIKLDNSGNTLWIKSYDFNWIYPMKPFLEFSDKSILLAVDKMVRLDSSGNLISVKMLFGNNIDAFIENLIQIDSTNIIATGIYNPIGTIDYKCFILKADLNGTIFWAKSFSNDLFTSHSFLRTIKSGNDYINSSDVIIGDSTYLSLTKVDSAGNIIWSNHLSKSIMTEDRYNIVEKNDELYINIGTREGLTDVNQLIIKVSGISGQLIWAKKYLWYFYYEQFGKLVLATNDELILFGPGESIGAGGEWIARLDTSGNISNIHHYYYPVVFPDNIITFANLIPYQSGYAVCGTVDYQPSRIYIGTLDSLFNSACFDSTGANHFHISNMNYTMIPDGVSDTLQLAFVDVTSQYSDSSITLPRIDYCQFVDVQSYLENHIKIIPNPIKDSFIISGLPENISEVKLDIFDVLKTHSTIKTEVVDGTINGNLNGLADGIYFIKITSGELTTLFKVIKL